MSNVWVVFAGEEYITAPEIEDGIPETNNRLLKIFDTKEKALDYIMNTPEIDILKTYDPFLTDEDEIEISKGRLSLISNVEQSWVSPKSFVATANGFSSEFYLYTFEKEVE